MQDRYTGDVGDFGKYGLLRALALPEITNQGGPCLRLGVVWYRHHDESHNADGNKISYLNDKKRHEFRHCDPLLYDCLRKIVKERASRKIAEVEKSGILGPNCRYFSEDCPSGSFQSRFEWRQRALASMLGCDLVFLDPDNGFIADFQDDLSAKHVYFCELQDFVHRGGTRALVLYHHPDRSTTHDIQIRHLVAELASKFSDSHHVAAFRYRRGTSRAFFMIWPICLHEILWPRIDAISNGPWVAEEHFNPVVSAGSLWHE